MSTAAAAVNAHRGAGGAAFRPAWWLPGPHAQTLWPVWFRRRPRLDLRREQLDLPDGDFVDLCWCGPDRGPIVAVFHGLEGCIDSHYAAGIMDAVQRAGWRGVFMHFRGCSGRHNRLDRSYHSGDTGDIAYLVETLAARYPGIPIGAVGYSLGGNALLKYLGETGSATAVRAAAAVSVPFELAMGADRLSRGVSRIYQRHLLGRLRRKIADKFRERAPAGLPLEHLDGLTTFHCFDDAITAPLHGFSGVDEYYRRSSSRQFLGGIRIPTLIIHACDDPFLTPAAVPAPSELPDPVRLEVSPSGGHVGFVGGRLPWRPEYWLDRRIPEFLADHLQ